ncbi:MAG: TetR/AcrR family transcriptional regulator [Roseomonas sp.]|nr:TetR/AcrR family transcriptional regulator [Roseomonas sp.]MCA3327136.1 TetR/AcrR family transcriptional regulator [Roseomonas sp.]MCA3331048.1 TetR/AcrR family transcriptional regulator [Roseomonas sp.]MCA3334132.1 TetR/AcrR family transcriptional regulator [Roseomonas sp.]MCA3348242.1 TetR/AcrR family transcriptional regulator [Roseomonas sp.]
MKKPYHHGNLRAALLEAARARLAEGAEATLSLRDLAARVGVSVNATYRHFDSKEALLMELAAEGFDALRAAMQEAVAKLGAAEAIERLRATGETYVHFAQDDPALFQLMFGREGRFAEHERFRDAAEAAFAVVVECVAAVQQVAPDLPSVTKAAVAAWSLVHGFAILSLGGYLAALPEARRPTTRDVVRMLEVGIA